MLGPQGAWGKQESDPDKVSLFEPRSTPAMNWLFALLAAGMAIGCALIALSDSVGLFQRWIVAVGALFFFYCAFLIARRANTRRPASFDARGLWIDGPTKRKLIAWDNIESISAVSISSQKFNMIALKEPQRLIEQYDDAEAKAAVGQENFVAMFSAAIGLGAPNSSDLTAMLANRRKQYGGEVWVTMHDRDRDAEAFEKLLKSWWRKYSAASS